MNHPIVLDLETQYTFQEVGYDPAKLKVSVVGIYDYKTDKYKAYREKDFPELFSVLEHASLLIGFNIKKFDLPVLAPYYLGNILQFPYLDILEVVEKSLGFRASLDDLSKATLGVKKNGHGFLAIDYFHKGQWNKLEEYCLHDVKMTKDLYEYGMKEGKFYFPTPKGKKEISISFSKKDADKTAISLSLPF